eukprot:6095543-Amphidinium_carterae.1
MTSDLQRNDMTGWYARKDIHHQYQIKGERLGRESQWGKTITVGKHMELKVVYKQQHRKAIEEKVKHKQNHFHEYSITTTSRNLDDNYAHSIARIEYSTSSRKLDQHQRVLQHFDKRAGHHFTEVNRRTLSTIQAQTPAEVQRDVDRLHPERFEREHAPQQRIQAVPEEQEIDENYDYAET